MRRTSRPHRSARPAALAVFVLAGVVAHRPSTVAEEARAMPADGQVEVGERLYREHCASCHGANLEGQADWRSQNADGRLHAPPHDETGHTWHHPDEQLFRITKLGPAAIVGDGYESDMPGFAGILTDDEIRATLAFIKSRWPERIRVRHERINRASEQ